MNSIKKKLDAVEDDLSFCDTKEELLDYFVELGKSCGDAPQTIKTPDNYVPGCVSEVYIEGKYVNGLMVYTGGASALIVRGYLALQLNLFSNATPEEIVSAEKYILEFIKNTKIDASALASRANAFGNIYLFIKGKAKKYA